MDFNREPLRKNKLINIILIIIFISLFLLLGLYLLHRPPRIRIESLNFSEVEFSRISLQIKGVGSFTSGKELILTAPYSADVIDIFYKAGDKVKISDIIAQIYNPDVDYALFKARSNLKQEQFRHTQMIEELTQDVNKTEESLLNMQDKLEIIELKFIADKFLASKNILSKIQLRQSELTYQAQKRSVLRRKQEHKFAMNRIVENRKLQLDKIFLLKEDINHLEKRFFRSKIKSTMNGMVKAVVDIGQHLLQGQQIAIIGLSKPDTALVRFPERQAKYIKLGDQVTLHYLHQRVIGIIKLIHPDVDAGYIKAEISIQTNPANNMPYARIDMNVRAMVQKQLQQMLLHVDMPSNVSIVNNQASVFVLRKDKLIRININILKRIDQYWIIKSGLIPGEKIVIAGLDEYQENEFILLDH